MKDATAQNETRTLSFKHTHSGEELTVTFKRNGRYDEEALKKINHLLRDWRSQDSTTMDRRLFDIVWEVYRDVDAKQPIHIISAYRSPKTNAMLRRRSSGVARHSQHMSGHAMDFFIPGVALADIRAAGLRQQRGGVGFYPTSGSPFVHLDTGSIRHWPRMTYDQLAKVFPNGRTVHVPTNGQPLKNYELAVADVQRRRNGDESSSRSGSRTFLASLFSSKSNEDEEETTTSAATPSNQKLASATKPAASEPASKSADAVPMPRGRPANAYQVASAAPVAAKPSSGRPLTVADIINSRGFWDDVPPPKPATAQQVAAIAAARAAVTDRQSTASLPPATSEAMAYAPANFADRVSVVTASAPMPRSIRPQNAGAKPMIQANTVVMKGQQPVPTAVTRAGTQHDSPWMRAMILAPNTYRFMLPTVIGDADMTAIRVHFVKPAVTVAMTFSGNATPGMTSERFTGKTLTVVPSMPFRTRTASLR